MPLIDPTETTRVALTTPGEWADVRSRITKGEEARMQGLALGGHRLGAGGLAEVEVTAEMYDRLVFAGIEVGLVAWSFPAPLTPENIRRLSTEDYDLLKAAIDDLWAPRSDEQRGN
ncbi:MAG: hypothetical protein FJ318_06025 [SAR202 cluster bacterium]|nr:hypothetical protein [SAR202 cluster bacterium]